MDVGRQLRKAVRWRYSSLYGFWYIPEHPEAGHIMDEDMPDELKETD
jgi:alkylated DNA repair dioxygenase AlkB